jgi:hypothetical protein
MIMLNRLSLQDAGKLLLATLAATTLALGGCTTSQPTGGSGGSAPTTTTGAGGDSQGTTTGGGGSSPTTTTTGTGGGQPGTSVALLDAQISQTEDQSMWLNAGEKLSPSTLIVIVSSEAQSCSAPVFNFGTKNHRQVLIGLPQALQAVGKYDISSTEVIAFGDFWLGDGMGNGGGGKTPLNQGTVEVVSIDAASIKVRLAGLANDFTSLEGADYLAARCP